LNLCLGICGQKSVVSLQSSFAKSSFARLIRGVRTIVT
jgi:hypothetical protein